MDILYTYTPRSRAERLIAGTRVLLAAASLLAIWLDPSEPARYSTIAYTLMSAYLGYALLLVPLAWTSAISFQSVRLGSHIVDLMIFTLFLYFTEGPTSPFFAYYIFSLFCAALRWHRAGTYWTAVAVLALFTALGMFMQFVLQDPEVELNRFIVRSAYLGIVALLLGHLSSYEENTRKELTTLASWPRMSTSPDQPSAVIGEVLPYAARVLQAPRALMIWEEPEEPYRHLTSFDGKQTTYRGESPVAFTPVVAEPLGETDFVCPRTDTRTPEVIYRTAKGFKHWRGTPLNPDLMTRFAITSLLAMRVVAEGVQGWMLFLDKPAMTSDDLVLGGIVAQRVTATLNEMEFQRRQHQTTLMEERIRFARDLHDGLLQSLTGIALQLVTVARSPNTDSPTHKTLEEIQDTLIDEQRRLRTLIQRLKPATATLPDLPSPLDTLNAWLEKLAKRIWNQWGLMVEWSEEPACEAIPIPLTHDIRHLIEEGLVNSARHAHATLTRLTLGVREAQVQIVVTDNGRGFTFRGRHELAELKAMDVGPRSLLERTASLQGQLVIDSSEAGVRLEITVPLPPLPPASSGASAADDNTSRPIAQEAGNADPYRAG